jgi:hypothetical protein
MSLDTLKTPLTLGNSRRYEAAPLAELDAVDVTTHGRGRASDTVIAQPR